MINLRCHSLDIENLSLCTTILLPVDDKQLEFVTLCLQDLFNAVLNIIVLPRWLSVALTLIFVGSTVVTAMLVTDLGSVLHLIGGTVASFMVFTLPGLLLMNAAIIKHTTTGSAGMRHVASVRLAMVIAAHASTCTCHVLFEVYVAKCNWADPFLLSLQHASHSYASGYSKQASTEGCHNCTSCALLTYAIMLANHWQTVCWQFTKCTCLPWHGATTCRV